MTTIVMTKQEKDALDWFIANFQTRKGKIHTQHRNGLVSLLGKVKEQEVADGTVGERD